MVIKVGGSCWVNGRAISNDSTENEPSAKKMGEKNAEKTGQRAVKAKGDKQMLKKQMKIENLLTLSKE
jgi:hypothetical protein